MEFCINKCSSLVVRGEVSRFLNRNDPTFYLSGQVLPKTNCYTYLGVPFSNDLELKPIIQRMNNKVRKALYSIKGFLKNPHIPIPFKKNVIFSYSYWSSFVLCTSTWVKQSKNKNSTGTSKYRIILDRRFFQREFLYIPLLCF